MERKTKHKNLTSEEKELIKQMHKDGMSIFAISMSLHIATTTVSRTLREGKLLIKHIEYCNAWQTEEDETIIQAIKDGYDYNYIQTLLPFRTVAAIKSRRNKLVYTFHRDIPYVVRKNSKNRIHTFILK